MLRCKVLALCLVAVLAAGMLATAASAGVISYNANADPAGSSYDGYPTEPGTTSWATGGPGSTGTAVDDGGTLAWRVEDGADNGWRIYPTSADVALGETNGWSLGARLKVVGGTPGYPTAALSSQNIQYHDNVNHLSAAMNINPSGSGDGSVKVVVNGNTSSVYTVANGCNQYNDYRLDFSPATSTVSFVLNGTTVATGLPLVDNSSWFLSGSRVDWGDVTGASNGTATVNYNQVLWSTPIPEPCTSVLLAMGMLGLLAYAWRKRR
jgi:hypothetical protein